MYPDVIEFNRRACRKTCVPIRIRLAKQALASIPCTKLAYHMLASLDMKNARTSCTKALSQLECELDNISHTSLGDTTQALANVAKMDLASNSCRFDSEMRGVISFMSFTGHSPPPSFTTVVAF